MCGINAIFAYDFSERIDPSELARVRDHMMARGPDGFGAWISAGGRAGLGHRRLAIIDLSEKAAQPMSTADGSIVVTFNGEIYNYGELRSGLEKKGYRFRSSSDTEVLLHLYAEKGEAMLDDLRGMFAFILWDNARRLMFVARDPFGIKPLYYADDGRTIRLASQVKALIAGGKIDTSPDPAGHAGFFLWGYVPEPYTMYKGIKSLPAGSYMTIDSEGRRKFSAYCDIASVFKDAERSAENMETSDMRSLLREALLDSLRHHLIADVPVGIFLSSGLDSSTLVALASEIIPPERLYTVTLGFKEYEGTINDETVLAEQVARHYGTNHRTILISKKDFMDDLPKVLEAMDQPTTDGVNSYFVSKAAKEAGLKVCLSGLGGDEIFGSYPSFKDIPRAVRMLSLFKGLRIFGRAARLITYPIIKGVTSPKYAGLLEYGTGYGGAYILRRGLFMPWELSGVLGRDVAEGGLKKLRTEEEIEQSISGIRGGYLRVSAMEFSRYLKNQLLRDADWAGMAHSLEIRTPFMDLPLLKALSPLFSAAERPQKKAMAMTPRRQVPDHVLQRRKTGFVVPVREWISDVTADPRKERGLRGWARYVYRRWNMMKTLVLATDAFGGHGGIALYSRDIISALCNHRSNGKVIAIPRLMPFQTEPLPDRLLYVTDGLNSKTRYAATIIKTVFFHRNFDLIICCHINLLPLAALLKYLLRVPVVLFIYGIDAWYAPSLRLKKNLLRKVDAVVSISETTLDRFRDWADLVGIRTFILPNAIHMDKYGSGPKKEHLIEKYGLHDKRVIMTLGRLVSMERYKGFDEIIELLPALLKDIPDLIYLIAGDGDDRSRLERKVNELGLGDYVVFAGFIPEAEKADLFRLADAYVMPSRGEGFGFVFLEAMACGVPVMGSTRDGGREALREGKLGILVDPDSRESIKAGILEVLRRPTGVVPDGLNHFSYQNFEQRLHSIIDSVMSEQGRRN